YRHQPGQRCVQGGQYRSCYTVEFLPRCGLAQSSGVSRTVVRFGRSSLPWRPLSRCYTPHDILLILRLRYTHTPSVAFLYLVWYNKTISMAIDYTICWT